ncbi:MAG: hypothetical protein AMJ46_03765 [Latescibacteria bacterium DG_63]|nr:MAG: hypothetical protein AMJ46_03765 [Latescibacteria bacterium DG_63]
MRGLDTLWKPFLFVLLLGTLLSVCAFAAWQDEGNPVCTETGTQQFADVIPDGAGGAIVVWEDYRGPDSDIYAQRLDASGAALWPANGVPICTTSGGQVLPEIASDGAGGAIIVWEDRRVPGGDIYVQRVDASGLALWATNGVPVCTTDASQVNPEIASDGWGGAVIGWQDFRGAGVTGWEIYVQRVDASGIALWTADGVAASTAWGTQWYPEIISDGAGGAIVTWADRRNWNSDVFVQRIDASGTVLWATDGETVCIVLENQRYPEIVSDGEGGAIIAWTDYRDGGATPDIYIQRVDESGTMLWTEGGVSVCSAAGDQFEPAIAPDDAGGAIVTWYDKRNGLDYDIYAQRLDTLGVPLWTADGVLVCAAANHQEWPVITADGTGGAVIAWHDMRVSGYDIYGQRVDSLGTALWMPGGVSLCSAAGNQRFPCVTTDGEGGAIAAWHDSRSGSDDIYAQRVSAAGCSGPTALTFASVSATGTSGCVELSWQMGIEVDAGNLVVERSEWPEGPFLSLNAPVLRGEGLSFSFTDRGVLSGRSYWYKIVLLSFSGREYYGPLEVYVEPTPVAYKVHQSYPNPFNPTCTIRYEMPVAGAVSLRVFDVSGSIVRTLVDTSVQPGAYSEVWDGRDQSGREVPSGVYFYRLEAGDFGLTRKAILLR